MSDAGHISLEVPLERMEPISLDEMDSIKLMNRIDTKYLTAEETLVNVLSDAAGAGYRVLEADGSRISPYDSLYFDTPSLKMFFDHHNRKLTRQKVRTRIYLNSGLAFLEIKRKNNKGRTKKKRVGIPAEEFGGFASDGNACRYLEEHSAFTSGELTPAAETAFRRITLVNPEKTERITIDTCLTFKNFRTGLGTSLQDAVVIEIKQDGRAPSPMKRILLDHRVKPVRISKYCIATTVTSPGLKTGRFKEKVRTIEKTINKKITAQ
ncbi:MAG: polyphosphate polymerase domain-containing protein [Bacteroidales bacterium]|nr:polyphosphate polymerase domain-containing protein [Bacteroidales bacterium]